MTSCTEVHQGKGETGIRTQDGLRHCRFQGDRIQPLCHLSGNQVAGFYLLSRTCCREFEMWIGCAKAFHILPGITYLTNVASGTQQLLRIRWPLEQSLHHQTSLACEI